MCIISAFRGVMTAERVVKVIVNVITKVCAALVDLYLLPSRIPDADLKFSVSSPVSWILS